MKKSDAVILAVVALVVGLLVGALAGGGMLWESMTSWSAQAELARTEIGLTKNLMVLKELHAGRPVQAREKLEQQLDLDVLRLDALKREHKNLENESFTSLPSILEYRMAVPYPSEDERVTRILKSAGERLLTTACTRTREQEPSSDCPSRAVEAGR